MFSRTVSQCYFFPMMATLGFLFFRLAIVCRWELWWKACNVSACHDDAVKTWDGSFWENFHAKNGSGEMCPDSQCRCQVCSTCKDACSTLYTWIVLRQINNTMEIEKLVSAPVSVFNVQLFLWMYARCTNRCFFFWKKEQKRYSNFIVKLLSLSIFVYAEGELTLDLDTFQKKKT